MGVTGTVTAVLMTAVTLRAAAQRTLSEHSMTAGIYIAVRQGKYVLERSSGQLNMTVLLRMVSLLMAFCSTAISEESHFFPYGLNNDDLVADRSGRLTYVPLPSPFIFQGSESISNLVVSILFYTSLFVFRNHNGLF